MSGAQGAAAPVVSVLVVAYDSADWLHRCLDSLADETPRHPREVLVLDNASPGDDAAVISAHDEVRGFTAPSNLGFARGVNRLAEQADGELLLLLNPDTEVRPGSIDALVDFLLARPDVLVAGGRTVSPDGTVDPSSCWAAPTPWSATCFGTGLSTAFKRHPVLDPESMGGWQRDSVREVDIVTGCLALVRRETWTRLGGFDERFFVYGEDADLALRVAAVGGRCAITPAAEIVHAVGTSTHRVGKLVLLHTGKATLVRKHWTGPARAWMLAMLVVGVALRAALETVGRSDDRPWASTFRRRAEWLPGFAPAPPPIAIRPV